MNPCKPHGRHERASSVSTTTESSDRGPKPKAVTVEQKTEVRGAFMAEAKCWGAESLTKFMDASFMSAADSRNDNFPDRFKEF